MLVLVKIFNGLMQAVYAIFKIFPARRKVIFLSRQVNEVSLDYLYLAEELRRRDPDIEIVTLCMRIEKNPASMIRFGWMLMRSLYHLATSKVCILDTYWPAVSLLSHKKSLTVIQLWHAMGKIKQSGHITLDREGGRGKKFATVLKMHENYDVIVAGAEAWNPFYCQSFNVGPEVLLNVGLPRIDYLFHKKDEIASRIHESYPQLGDKPVILYAPTFRRTGNEGWERLLEAIDLNRYNLVIKSHPNQPLHYDSAAIFELPEFTAVDALTVADYLITDYSAIAVEAAVISVKTYYYLYDYNVYTKKNGLNIDLFKEMPGCVFTDALELIRNLELGNYNQEALHRYRRKFLPKELGRSTELIADRVMEGLK